MRLLALPVIAAALAFPASASANDVPCFGTYAGSANVGVCAGVVCNDLCAPEVVVHGKCAGLAGHPTLVATCAVVNAFRVTVP